MAGSELAIEEKLEAAELPHHADNPPRCVACHTKIHEGSPVTVLALRDAPGASGAHWRVDRVWSIGCAEHEFAALPGLLAGVEGPAALVEGDVAVVADAANQTHWPCLIRATVVDTAWPTADEPQPDGGEVLIRDPGRETLNEWGMVR